MQNTAITRADAQPRGRGNGPVRIRGRYAAEGGVNGDEPGAMVLDSSLFFPGRLVWGRPVRAHRPHPHLECVAAIVVCDHPTRYGGTPSTVLDPRPCGYHRVHSLGALPDLE